jgi:hypothetical protein
MLKESRPSDIPKVALTKSAPMVAVRQDFLRQHYLDQVHGSDALPRNTLSLYAGTRRHRLAPR